MENLTENNEGDSDRPFPNWVAPLLWSVPDTPPWPGLAPKNLPRLPTTGDKRPDNAVDDCTIIDIGRLETGDNIFLSNSFQARVGFSNYGQEMISDLC